MAKLQHIDMDASARAGPAEFGRALPVSAQHLSGIPSVKPMRHEPCKEAHL